MKTFSCFRNVLIHDLLLTEFFKHLVLLSEDLEPFLGLGKNLAKRSEPYHNDSENKLNLPRNRQIKLSL